MNRLGKRERLATALDRLSLLDTVGRLRRRFQCDLTILAYHRVFDIDDEERFPFDPELVSASRARFHEQMLYARRHHDPIDFATLAAAEEGLVELPPRPLIVTFDDGYEDNFTNALPILDELGVPATIFLSTGYIGSERTFWYDRVAYAAYRAPRGTLRLPGVGPAFEIHDLASRRRAARLAIRSLQRLPDRARRAALTELAARGELAVRDEDRHLSRPLAWKQVRELAAFGIEIGAHTVSHPVLRRCDEARLDHELRESRLVIEEELDLPVTTMSYPFGGPDAYDRRVMDAASRSGYRFAASYVAGRNEIGALDRFALRRLHVERYTSLVDLRSMIAAPQIFARG